MGVDMAIRVVPQIDPINSNDVDAIIVNSRVQTRLVHGRVQVGSLG